MQQRKKKRRKYPNILTSFPFTFGDDIVKKEKKIKNQISTLLYGKGSDL